MIIGIDLGTTNSLVSAWIDGVPVLIPNTLGSFLTPSVVGLDDDGSVVVGMAARERLPTHPHLTAAAFKRYMGTNREMRLGERSFRPEELSSFILRSLKADAEAYLGVMVNEAIITVPAYFNDIQRKATKTAAEMAGLKVERLLNEPTAAALAYGLQESGPDRKIMVLDLGGGTFDVSILEMFSGIMEVRSSSGDNRLGGEDFVELIMDAFIEKVEGVPPRSHPSPLHAPLRRQAEVAKRALNDEEHVRIELTIDEKIVGWTLDRIGYEALCEPLLRRMKLPIERAIRDASLRPEDISDLVLAGGATRMSMVRRMAARLFQRLPLTQINPDEIVARGAAVQAGLKMCDAALDDMVMTDVAPFSLGISARFTLDGNAKLDGLFAPIIERNTTIPVSRERDFFTSVDNQKVVSFSIYQGESRMVADNILLGKMSISVPLAPAGKEKVSVRFTYDVSGLLEVELRNSRGQAERSVIEGAPGLMTEAEIAARLEELKHLKIHPRNNMAVRTVLARAGRLYEERLGQERELIGLNIDAFRAIVERQNPQEIQSNLEAFEKWLDAVDRSFFL